MGLDKLRVMSEAEPKRDFFDMLNADFRLPAEERRYVYRFQYRDREEIHAMSPTSQVRIHTRPKVTPFVFVELNHSVPSGKLPPQTIVECNPNRFADGFDGVCRLLDSMFQLKDALKVTRLDLNADIEGVNVQYFRDALRYPQKRKSGDIGEYRKRGTETLYIGRRPMLLRVYDKIQELKYHGVDPSSLPPVLTRTEWESHGRRWNLLPHTPGAEITHFSDLPNLLRFQPFARLELFEVPVYDFENETQGSIHRLTFQALAEKQSAQAAVSILNKKRNFSRDYRHLLLNNEDVLNQIQKSYLDTTRRFFNNQGADVRFLYNAKAVVSEPHDV